MAVPAGEALPTMDGGAYSQVGGPFSLPQLVHQQPTGKLSFCEVMKEKELKRGFVSVIATLTIGIMGGAVLPIAWAFSVTGIFVGMLTMVLVSAANAYTSNMLLRQSYKTGASSYEDLAYKIGGAWWKLVTEISIVIVLLGTLVGGMQQTGEAGSLGIHIIWPNSPGWLVNGGGRTVMALGTVFVVGPLCMAKQLRQLVYTGVLGTCIVLFLVSTVVTESARDHLPALRNHEFHRWGFTSIGDISQAVSIFGFAFYIQPLMMALLLEMPPGKVGAKVVAWGTRVVVLGNACLVYSSVGLFGASRYGKDTEENILQNSWMGGGVAQGVLNLSMALYLTMANPMAVFPLRACINGWVSGNRQDSKHIRHIVLTVMLLVVALGIAEAFSGSSGKVLTVTGATGVCLVSYLIPIVNHLLLFTGRAQCQKEARKVTVGMIAEMEKGSGHDMLQGNALSYRSTRGPGCAAWLSEMAREIMLPIAVLFIGLFCGVAALSTIGQG